MIKPKKPFSLYKRPTTNKRRFIYYVQFRDENGDYMTAMSSHQSSKSAAINWANEHIKKGYIPVKRGLAFKDFARDFWIWDKCEYIKAKLARGDRLSKGYAEISRRNLVNHLLPYYSKYKLAEIRPGLIEKWLIDQYENSNFRTQLNPTNSL